MTEAGTGGQQKPLAWHDTYRMPPPSAATTEARRVVVVSYRLGGGDGVSTEAAKWIRALRLLGCSVRTLAGEGWADFVEPGLAAGRDVTGRDAPPPDVRALRRVLDRADLVVVENLCSLPLNPRAGAAVAAALRGRPALFRHHDLPWQREAFADWGPPPDDPAWRHVVVNEHSRSELAERGITATTVRNAFDPFPPPGDRQSTRMALGVASDELLAVQPTRAIARKGIPTALALAEQLGAFYWLVGVAEEGYGPTVEKLLDGSPVRSYWGRLPGLVTAGEGIENAYAAADLVLFPSVREGFGNPPVESALHRRPAVVGHYQAAEELRRLGFCWLDPEQPDLVAEYLATGNLAGGPADLLGHNAEVARRHLNLDDLPRHLALLMGAVGLHPPRPLPPGAVPGPGSVRDR